MVLIHMVRPNLVHNLNSLYYIDCLPSVYGGGQALGYNSNVFKPSYAYQTNYGGGGGLSGYEGPQGGYNTYMQPGISYPSMGIFNSG